MIRVMFNFYSGEYMEREAEYLKTVESWIFPGAGLVQNLIKGLK